MRKKRKKKNSRLLFVLLFCVIILFIYFNINIWRERVKRKESLVQIEERITKELQKQTYLEVEEGEERIEDIERIARENLLLQKQDEEVVVIRQMEEKEKEEEKEERSFWDKILDLLP